MRLELGTFPVTDIAFGPRTRYDGGRLTVDREAVLAAVQQDPRIATAELEIARPGESVRWSAGTNGFRKRRVSPPSVEPRSSSTRLRSAGTRARRPSTVRRSTGHGKRFSAATPSPTASSSPRSTGSAPKATSSSGAARSSPTRSDGSWRAPATIAKKFL